MLDLDNTLWGGVIGDDGLAGIALGQGSATGEAFLAVQRMALELRGRGVVLAVCSKNEEDAARSPFREHPDMLLREDDIAVFQANWTDKAANLRAIAEALNIGVDALVFLDDNPAERAQVRRELPLVGGARAAGRSRPLSAHAGRRRLLRSGRLLAGGPRARRLLPGQRRTGEGALRHRRHGRLSRPLEMVCPIGPVDALSRGPASPN